MKVLFFCLILFSTGALADFDSDVCTNVDSQNVDQNVSILVKNGYSASVAKRISCLRPDIVYLVEHPEIKVSYEIPLHDKDMAFTRTINQNRRAIKVYRGFSLRSEQYDPRFTKFWAATIPGVMFVAKQPEWAFSFANHISDIREGQRAGDPALILEYEIPRFFLKTEYTPGHPITTSNDVIIYRGVMPDDTPFISRVLIMKKSQKYAEKVPANLLQRFSSLDNNLAYLPLIQPHVDTPFNENGRLE